MHKSFIVPPVYRGVAKRSRGYLPHWEIDGGVYFITFRLADSLPAEVAGRLDEERKALAASMIDARANLTAVDRCELARLHAVRLDHALDRGYGSCCLRNPKAADVVKQTLELHNAIQYDLYAWCVMPNHVHVVVELSSGSTLARTLHSWKSYTANAINRFLGRSGRLWQREYFDRLIRDREDLLGTVQYVIDNPVKAGLIDWPWVWVKQPFER
jgi:REP element-mobilizing transposase RayT